MLAKKKAKINLYHRTFGHNNVDFDFYAKRWHCVSSLKFAGDESAESVVAFASSTISPFYLPYDLQYD